MTVDVLELAKQALEDRSRSISTSTRTLAAEVVRLTEESLAANDKQGEAVHGPRRRTTKAVARQHVASETAIPVAAKSRRAESK